jgi:hypothetical protein
MTRDDATGCSATHDDMAAALTNNDEPKPLKSPNGLTNKISCARRMKGAGKP